jgi:hypothetical protein
MFKHIKIALFLSVLAYQPAEAALQSERFFDNTGGLVDRYSPILVPSKASSDLQNVQLDQRGQLLKRHGYDLNNVTSFMAVSTVTGGGYHQSTTGTSFLAVVSGTNVFTTGNTFGGTYTNVVGTITLTGSINNLAQLTSFNDWAVICNDLDAPIQINASTAYRIPNISTGAKTCESFNSYLIVGNLSEGGATFGSRIRWSDIGALNTWPANNYIDVEPSDGDSIVSIKRYQNNVYVFKKRSIYELIITGGAGAEAFIVRPIARGIGAWAKNSVKAIDNRGIVFLGQNGVYMFDGSNFDFISDPIQRKIDGLNRSRYQYAVAEVYPPKNQYWLSVSNGVDIQNKTILVYDYIQQAWTVYAGIRANALMAAEDNNGNVVLFSGDYSGHVYKQDTGTMDEPDGVSTAISAYYASANLSFGSPEIDKTFKYLYIFSKATTEATINVDIAINYQDGYVETKTLAIGATGAVWGTAIWGTDVWPGTATQVHRLELNRTAKAIRFKFSDSSSTELGVLGWTVVYDLEDYRNE